MLWLLLCTLSRWAAMQWQIVFTDNSFPKRSWAHVVMSFHGLLFLFVLVPDWNNVLIRCFWEFFNFHIILLLLSPTLKHFATTLDIYYLCTVSYLLSKRMIKLSNLFYSVQTLQVHVVLSPEHSASSLMQWMHFLKFSGEATLYNPSQSLPPRQLTPPAFICLKALRTTPCKCIHHTHSHSGLWHAASLIARLHSVHFSPHMYTTPHPSVFSLNTLQLQVGPSGLQLYCSFKSFGRILYMWKPV